MQGEQRTSTPPPLAASLSSPIPHCTDTAEGFLSRHVTRDPAGGCRRAKPCWFSYSAPSPCAWISSSSRNELYAPNLFFYLPSLSPLFLCSMKITYFNPPTKLSITICLSIYPSFSVHPATRLYVLYNLFFFLVCKRRFPWQLQCWFDYACRRLDDKRREANSFTWNRHSHLLSVFPKSCIKAFCFAENVLDKIKNSSCRKHRTLNRCVL